MTNLQVPGVSILGLLTFNAFGDSISALKTMLWAGPIADIGSVIVTIILVTIECNKIRKLVRLESNENITATIFNEKYTITIGREYGSGGKYIGEQLAKRLGIKCYDKELLSEVSKDYNIDLKTLESVDEKQKSKFWYSFATNYVFNDKNNSPISADDNLFLKQAKVIEDISDREECVIIGRCSDYILKNRKNVFNVFIYSSDMNFKINRKMKYDNMSEKKIIKKIERIDNERADYYERFTSQTWGEKKNYDICIDTSKIGMDEAVSIIEMYIKKVQALQI